MQVLCSYIKVGFSVFLFFFFSILGSFVCLGLHLKHELEVEIWAGLDLPLPRENSPQAFHFPLWISLFACGK